MRANIFHWARMLSCSSASLSRSVIALKCLRTSSSSPPASATPAIPFWWVESVLLLEHPPLARVEVVVADKGDEEDAEDALLAPQSSSRDKAPLDL